MSSIRKSGPPPRPDGRKSAWADRLREAAADPGEWFAIDLASANSATAVGCRVRDEIAPRYGYSVEATSRTNQDGTGTLYFRVLEAPSEVAS